MELSDEQKTCVSGWVAEGMGLSDIQKRLKNELGIGLTFMDVRFLVSDLELKLKTEEKKPAVDDPVDDVGSTSPAPDPEAEFSLDSDDSSSEDAAVSVEVDKVVRPGAAVSGSVVFSDGKKADWYMDQFGQLGIIPPEDGYQPSPEDVEAFQAELRNSLKSSPL